MSGALLVKVFGRERAEVQRFSEKLQELKNLSLEQSLVGRWFQMVLGLFESIGPALAFAVGGTLVIRGHLALGTVVAFVTVLKRLYGPASQLATAHVDLKTSYAYFDRIFAVMDRTPAIRNSEAAVIPTRIVGDVEFRHVSLAYDDAGEVLSRINLNVPAGATIGLVGPSGAGKTSLVSLVMRLVRPDGRRRAGGRHRRTRPSHRCAARADCRGHAGHVPAERDGSRESPATQSRPPRRQTSRMPQGARRSTT